MATETRESAYRSGTMIGGAIVLVAALLMAVVFGLGVWAGEQRVNRSVQEKACHLVGGRWWHDRSQCVEYVRLPSR